jgi:hypothetical protein
MEKLILNLYEISRALSSQKSLGKETKIGGLLLPEFKTP